MTDSNQERRVVRVNRCRCCLFMFEQGDSDQDLCPHCQEAGCSIEDDECKARVTL